MSASLSVEPVRESTDTLTGADRPIHVERFAPAVTEPSAGVVLLHGADGLERRGTDYREMARQLAGRGYRTILPHYLESTGTYGHALAANPLDTLGWLDAITVTLGVAGPGPVGLVGFSLGAYLAVAAAGRDERVGAVVSCFGGLPELVAGQITRLPPVLILHGEADPVVPVGQAHELARWLDARSLPYELHVYPGLGHSFIGDTAADALRRTRAFLDKHLLGKPAAV